MKETKPSQEIPEWKDFWNSGCAYCGKLGLLKAKVSVEQKNVLWECIACNAHWFTRVKNELYNDSKITDSKELRGTKEKINPKRKRQPRESGEHD